ncbi:hypothetical protein KIPB_007978, partial [Kipferlia bialata]|eukprot:g7978.t1
MRHRSKAQLKQDRERGQTSISDWVSVATSAPVVADEPAETPVVAPVTLPPPPAPEVLAAMDDSDPKKPEFEVKPLYDNYNTYAVSDFAYHLADWVRAGLMTVTEADTALAEAGIPDK